jgi:hypothetical protein
LETWSTALRALGGGAVRQNWGLGKGRRGHPRLASEASSTCTWPTIHVTLGSLDDGVIVAPSTSKCKQSLFNPPPSPPLALALTLPNPHILSLPPLSSFYLHTLHPLPLYLPSRTITFENPYFQASITTIV